MKDVTVVRKSTESEMKVLLSFDVLASDYRKKIDTGILFLNHMIEQIVWRSEINVVTSVKLDRFDLSHVVAEDLGMTFGKAVARVIVENIAGGIIGFGDGIGIIDEAKAQSAMSFEGRAYLDLDFHGNTVPAVVEGMQSEDLVTFLDGFVQGAQCTLHIDLLKGVNGHHIWEAIFRSFGIALKNTLMLSPSRANRTSGVAGKVEYIYE